MSATNPPSNQLDVNDTEHINTNNNNNNNINNNKHIRVIAEEQEVDLPNDTLTSQNNHNKNVQPVIQNNAMIPNSNLSQNNTFMNLANSSPYSPTELAEIPSSPVMLDISNASPIEGKVVVDSVTPSNRYKPDHSPITFDFTMNSAETFVHEDTSPLECETQLEAPDDCIPIVAYPEVDKLNEMVDNLDLDNHPEMQSLLTSIEHELLGTLKALAVGQALEPVVTASPSSSNLQPPSAQDDGAVGGPNSLRRVSWKATGQTAIPQGEESQSEKIELLDVVRSLQKSSIIEPKTLFDLSRSLMKVQGYDMRISSLSRALVTALSHVDVLGELFTKANEGRISAKEALRLRMTDPVSATATLVGSQAAGIARQATLTRKATLNDTDICMSKRISGVPAESFEGGCQKCVLCDSCGNNSRIKPEADTTSTNGKNKKKKDAKTSPRNSGDRRPKPTDFEGGDTSPCCNAYVARQLNGTSGNQNNSNNILASMISVPRTIKCKTLQKTTKSLAHEHLFGSRGVL